MKVKFDIKGDAILRRNLIALSRVDKGNINPVLRDALEPMLDATKQNAMALRQEGTNPPGGHLDEGVVSVPVKSGSRTRATWWVSFARRARKIAHLVEFGTAPHAQPRRGIMHPGATPRPFFRTAFETTKGITLQRLASSLRGLMNNRIKR